MKLSSDAAPVHVSSDDIARYVGMDLAVEAARAAALASASGAVTTRRSQLFFDGGWMRIMSAEVSSLGVFGFKEFHLAGSRYVRYCVHVFETETGRPLGIVDAARITPLRRAATAAVAVRHFVGDRPDVRLGIIGTGSEALAGLEALSQVVRLAEVRATSRSAENREKFARDAEASTGLVVAVPDSLEKTLADVDVAYVATNSGGKIVVGHDDLARVDVIASIGSTLPIQRELSGDVLSRADRVVVDTLDVLDESGDVLEAIDAGWDTTGVKLLGSAIGEPAPSLGVRTVYKSIGSPEQDLVLAAAIVRHAADVGFGRSIEPLSAVKENL